MPVLVYHSPYDKVNSAEFNQLTVIAFVRKSHGNLTKYYQFFVPLESINGHLLYKI